MKGVLRFVMVAAIVPCAFGLWAQTKKTDEKAQKPKPKPIPVYLGKSDISSGLVKEQTFDSYLKEGLTSRDSAGNPYKINGFTFSYAERNLYEDSVGNLMLMTDYLSEYCFGDTLSTALINNITNRSKYGDTVFIDQITLTSAEGKAALGKSMKLVLTK